MGTIIALLVGKFTFLPEPLRKLAAWITVILAVAGLILSAKVAYDASVIDDYEGERAIESIEARDEAADQRSTDAIKNTESEREAHEAINSVPADDAQRALDCLRLARVNIFPTACGRVGGD